MATGDGVRPSGSGDMDKAVAQASRAGQIIHRMRQFIQKGETERQAEEHQQADRGGERAGAGRRQGKRHVVRMS